MSYREVTFRSAGVECDGWHFVGRGDRFLDDRGRPVVVMAHGLGGTKDSGLAPFAQKFADAGLDVLTFDYRGFGRSAGEPRQVVSIAQQVQDYRAAIDAAKRLPDVAQNRIVLWGVSLAGGHVLTVGAHRNDVAAVIALTPMTDGLATGKHVLAYHNPSSAARWGIAGIKSRVAVGAGRSATLMPLAARPGQRGALTLDGDYENYLSIAGPTWRNEIDAGIGVEMTRVRASRFAQYLQCPLLVQIADFDRSAPPYAALKTAVKGRGQVHHYPCDHFDVWPGKAWFDQATDHQVAFLERALTAPTSSCNSVTDHGGAS